MNEKELTHISLFSGIGGFDLAARWAGFRTVAFCEIEPFCQEVLKARFGAVADAEQRGRRTRAGEATDGRRAGEFECGHRRLIANPNTPRFQKREGKDPARTRQNGGAKSAREDRGPVLIPDIRDFDGTRFRGATLLTGGFPCQPFSCAGKRGGKEDDRHLWPEMLRVIREAWPAWVIGENVSGIIGMELDQVLADLEMEGYACRTFHVGAVGVNAPHRRMRVWIVAHAILAEAGGGYGTATDQRRRASQGRRTGLRQTDGAVGSSRASAADSDAPNAPSGGRKPRRSECSGLRGGPTPDGSDSDAPDAETICLQGCQRGQGEVESGRGRWDIPWVEVAASLCRVDDGLPAWIHARRIARLKALGNAIVPQVAYEIIKAIAEIERGA